MPVGDQPFQSPARATLSPSAIRRGTASISASATSAVSSVRTPGVLVTVIPRPRRGQVDMVDPGAERGNQLQLVAGRVDQVGIDPVGNGWNENIGLLDDSAQLFVRHRHIGLVQPCIEQLPHPRFRGVGQLSGQKDDGLILGHSFRSSQDVARICGTGRENIIVWYATTRRFSHASDFGKTVPEQESDEKIFSNHDVAPFAAGHAGPARTNGRQRRAGGR